MVDPELEQRVARVEAACNLYRITGAYIGSEEDKHDQLENDLRAILAALRNVQAEVARLNTWADGFSDAQLKERATGEHYQRELKARAEAAEAKLSAMVEAARPFVNWSQDNVAADYADGTCGFWQGNGCERERINNWFGPTDFLRLRTASDNATGNGGEQT